MALPTHVKVVEVGPRDGLQNEAQTIPAEIKIALIDRLSQAGFANIEAASFVSPKWVPQMATSTEVMAGIARRAGAEVPQFEPFRPLSLNSAGWPQLLRRTGVRG